MKNVLCVGELLIDFICSDINSSIVVGENFKKKAGGAPANVSAAISKLGGKAAFLGKVGNDPFGEFLKNTLGDANVDTSMLYFDSENSTTLSFVSLKSDGQRDFVFDRGADGMLKYDEIDLEKLYSNNIFHFGSATALLGGDTKDTYMKIMNEVKESGKFISFDPNYRGNLWEDRTEDFIKTSLECIEMADFIKLSDDELYIITGKKDVEEGLKELSKGKDKIFTVTLGKEGTLVSNGKDTKKVKSVKIKSIDSTGAGDAFIGAVLYKISFLDNPKEIKNDFKKVEDIVCFANKVGAAVCTKLGAIAALPTIEEIEGI
ncbi:MAG: carbohydrate kinase [Clostridium sp.]|nr:carbohydrate kinase [Clostridium sp.]